VGENVIEEETFAKAAIQCMVEVGGDRKSREVCTPRLFVPDHVGQVLHCRVRGDGKDAGHRLFVRTHRMQRQHAIHRFITVRDSISNSVKEKDT
jgi:hypothetical protein